MKVKFVLYYVDMHETSMVTGSNRTLPQFLKTQMPF